MITRNMNNECIYKVSGVYVRVCVCVCVMMAKMVFIHPNFTQWPADRFVLFELLFGLANFMRHNDPTDRTEFSSGLLEE